MQIVNEEVDMTIDEASRLQDELVGLLPEVGFNKYTTSTKLGIEALKRVKWHKEQHKAGYYELLPGETKD